jgi:hypothetical protein
MEILARICDDPRNKDVVVSAMAAIDERLFSAWSMGYARNADLSNALCKEYGQNRWVLSREQVR